MVVKKTVRRSKNKQIKGGKIGKLEAKRKKILELKSKKKQERLTQKIEKKVEEAKQDAKVDDDGFFVLPTEVRPPI